LLEVERKILDGYSLSSQGFESDESISEEEIKDHLKYI